MAPSNILPYALDNTDNAIVKELDYLLGRMKALSVQYVDESMRDETDLLEHRSPDELKRLLDLSLPQAGVGAEGIFKTVEETFKYSVRSWNPRFMEKLYAGTNPVGVLSELLIAVMNANCHVYQVSPVFTLMEVAITEAMSKMLGFKAGSGGLVCPGGSASNQLAMITARNALFPHIKTEGPLRGEILTVFTSAHSHYSIDKSAMALGIGSKHVIKVPCTREGRMIPEELERLILESKSRGEVPFFVNATAGTTVLAAFDPIREIANIGHRHNCWVHVDGSWGGSVIFSKNHRALMDGSELVDTVTINPHKLLGTPLQCSALLARRGLGVFKEANSLNAGYLFHGNSVDLGDGTIGCGRRPDAVKMFMAWKYYGADGFNARLERAFNNVQHMATSIKTHPRFQLVVQPESVNVCFWYIPASIPANLATTDPEAYRMTISHVTRVLNERLTASGRFLVDYAPYNHPVVLPLFFRLPINPPTITPGILDELLDTLAALGEVEEVTVAAKGGWVKCAKEVDIHRKMELSKAANLVESRST